MGKEVELRARVDTEAKQRLASYLAAQAGVRVQTRCFIDYSTFLEGIGERKLDVRFRMTDGIPEIVVKKGVFGAAVREEAAARLLEADAEGGLSLMALLGYQKGVCGGRRICRVTVGDIEFALQDVLDFAEPSHVADCFLEVEYVGDVGDADEVKAQAELNSCLSQFGLTAFSIEQWNAYIAELNERWNGVYVHGETPIDVVRSLGS